MVSNDGSIYKLSKARWTSLLVLKIKGRSVDHFFGQGPDGGALPSGVTRVGPLLDVGDIDNEKAVELLAKE